MTAFSLQQIVNQSGVQFGTSGARGLVIHMTDAVCYAYTQAFLNTVATEKGPVVIGHDLRPSSSSIAAACAQAVYDAGREIVFAGEMPTPAIAYYASIGNRPSIVITGSHIPFDRNGIKFYKVSGEISKDDEKNMLSATVVFPAEINPRPLPRVETEATTAYIRRYTDFFQENSLAGMTIGLYEHSSVGRDVIRAILTALGAKVLSLGRTETFVPIDTEAVRPEDVARAKQWAQEHEFDALISTDGDADRPLIGDERGLWMRGDIVGILCSKFLGADIVVTPVSSNTAVETCDSFKKVLRTCIGSPYVIAAMEAAHTIEFDVGDVVVGYEANGGFLLGSDIRRGDSIISKLLTRDAVLPMLALLTMAKQSSVKVSDLADDLPQRYTASDRLQNFASERSKILLTNLVRDLDYAARLLAPDSGAVVDSNTVDGLRLTFSNGDIVHLRPSGNAPELRCYAESRAQEHATALCLSCLRRIANDLPG